MRCGLLIYSASLTRCQLLKLCCKLSLSLSLSAPLSLSEMFNTGDCLTISRAVHPQKKVLFACTILIGS